MSRILAVLFAFFLLAPQGLAAQQSVEDAAVVAIQHLQEKGALPVDVRMGIPTSKRTAALEPEEAGQQLAFLATIAERLGAAFDDSDDLREWRCAEMANGQPESGPCSWVHSGNPVWIELDEEAAAAEGADPSASETRFNISVWTIHDRPASLEGRGKIVSGAERHYRLGVHSMEDGSVEVETHDVLYATWSTVPEG